MPSSLPTHRIVALRPWKTTAFGARRPRMSLRSMTHPPSSHTSRSRSGPHSPRTSSHCRRNRRDHSSCRAGSSVRPPRPIAFVNRGSSGYRYTPIESPCRRQASATSLTRLPWPPFHGILRTQYAVVSVGHQQNPPTCLHTRRICPAPHDFAARQTSSASNPAGAIFERSAVPSRSYSAFSQVATPKWTNMIRSCSCHAYCAGDGRARSAAGAAGTYSNAAKAIENPRNAVIPASPLRPPAPRRPAGGRIRV